jgi:ribosome-binding protein aMBF1 (putative translation factor)
MTHSITKIRKAIESSGLSYRELAEASEVHHVSIWRFFHQKREMRSENLGKLIDALGLDVVQKKGVSH